MQNKKLRLKEIAINSFITNIESNEKETVLGATGYVCKTIDTQNPTAAWQQGCPGITQTQPCATYPPFTGQGALLCDITRTIIVSITQIPDYKPNPDNQCSAFRRGSCGGTLGAAE